MSSKISLLSRQPLASAAVLVSIFVGLLLLLPNLEAVGEPHKEIVRNIYRYSASFLILWGLIKLDWGRAAGITVPPSMWPKKWWIAAISMSGIALLNFAGVEFDKLEFSTYNAAAWLLDNFAAGLFEETVMRAMCFYILLRAWGNTRSGLYRAVIVQALIFGLLHLLNLRHSAAIDVGAQVIYATLIGIGFGGLIAYTRTLWVPVVVHALINAAGSLNEYFVPNYTDSAGNAGAYVVAIILILFLATLPGIFCMRKALLFSPKDSDVVST